MPIAGATNGYVTVNAYQGDAKTPAGGGAPPRRRRY
jgi:hypothetical protein